MLAHYEGWDRLWWLVERHVGGKEPKVRRGPRDIRWLLNQHWCGDDDYKRARFRYFSQHVLASELQIDRASDWLKQGGDNDWLPPRGKQPTYDELRIKWRRRRGTYGYLIMTEEEARAHRRAVEQARARELQLAAARQAEYEAEREAAFLAHLKQQPPVVYVRQPYN